MSIENTTISIKLMPIDPPVAPLVESDLSIVLIMLISLTLLITAFILLLRVSHYFSLRWQYWRLSRNTPQTITRKELGQFYQWWQRVLKHYPQCLVEPFNSEINELCFSEHAVSRETYRHTLTQAKQLLQQRKRLLAAIANEAQHG